MKASPEHDTPIRNPSFSFDDGNIAVKAGKSYFLVHQGLLFHHSRAISDAFQSRTNHAMLEGRPQLDLPDSSVDVLHFLKVLYDGISSFKMNAEDFCVVSSILRVATKYGADRLRSAVLEKLRAAWPTTLQKWEQREHLATDSAGLYSPRPIYPHPIHVINVAREIGANDLLPSAFYDLCRYLPSQVAAGYTSVDLAYHRLSSEDLLRILRGREITTRFFSSFIVNNLENRKVSNFCSYAGDEDLDKRNSCQRAFEAITFELLRDVHGLVCNRNSDPLYAISESYGMQIRVANSGANTSRRACERCRMELAAAVNASREDFWRNLPGWFDVPVTNWG